MDPREARTQLYPPSVQFSRTGRATVPVHSSTTEKTENQ